MQLNEFIKTNLFNDLSNQEQEVVAGGLTGSFTNPYGTGIWVDDGAAGGSFTWITTDGTKYVWKRP